MYSPRRPGRGLLREIRDGRNRSTITAGGRGIKIKRRAGSTCQMISSGEPSPGGYPHRRSFPPPFATFAGFFVSHLQIFMSRFPGKSQNCPGWHNPAENGLQNLPLQASLDDRSKARTGSGKLGGSAGLQENGATPLMACRLFTSVHDGEWRSCCSWWRRRAA
jgi:hypothetical protein